MIHQHYINYIPQQTPIKKSTQMKKSILISTQKLEHINKIIDEEENMGAVFLGDTISILKPEILQENSIEAILCCNREAALHMNLVPCSIMFKILEMHDHSEYPIHVHFESANKFVQENREKRRNVLIQCHGGISRSATMLCAYLIKSRKIGAEEAINFISKRRPRIKPNPGFWEKLVAYEKDVSYKYRESVHCSPETVKKSYPKEVHSSSEKIIKKFFPTSPSQQTNSMKKSLPYYFVYHLP